MPNMDVAASISNTKEFTLSFSFKNLIKLELLSISRHKLDLLNPAVFFLVISCLFPLALSPDPKLLQQYGAGIIWVSTILAMMLNLTKLFSREFESGEIENLLLSPRSLPLLLLTKITAQWMMTIIPLLILTPVITLFFHLSLSTLGVLILTLAIGTPSLFLLAAIASALTISLKHNSLLLSILTVPLFIPILIFATGCVNASQQGLPYSGLIALLLSILIVCLILAPWACASALRMMVGNE